MDARTRFSSDRLESQYLVILPAKRPGYFGSQKQVKKSFEKLRMKYSLVMTTQNNDFKTAEVFKPAHLARASH